MASLLEFRYERAGELAEAVSVDEGGSVRRTVSQPADATRAIVGVWSGALDADGVERALGLAGEDWTVTGGPGRPPGVGGWWATKADGRLGLWSAVGLDTAGSQLVGRLAALLTLCLAAASTAAAAVSMTAWWGALGDERLAMVRMENSGDDAVFVRAADDPGAPPAAFMNDDAEVVGFLGGDVELAPHGSATALVRDRRTTEGTFVLSGTVRGEHVPPIAVRLAVPIVDG